ncbi:MAG: alpha/beta fold hydrolase [Bdellovibrionales bacterium]|nr:alpha/beta fold hydrolase [Bdellovibrionales bacterium]
MLTWNFYPQLKNSKSEVRETIIFLHAFPFSSQMWNEIVEKVSRHYSCLTVDLPGFASDEVEHAPWTFAMVTEEICRYMKNHQIDKAVLCGCSMGGYSALDFVFRYPALCSGLILMNTQAIGDSNDAKDKRSETLQKVLSSGTSDFIKGFLASALAPHTQKHNPSLVDRLSVSLQQQSPLSLAHGLLAMSARKDFSSQLTEITVPTLIVSSSNDQAIPFSQSEEMATKIPVARLENIADAGHLTPLEQPTICADRILNFMNSQRTMEVHHSLHKELI